VSRRALWLTTLVVLGLTLALTVAALSPFGWLGADADEVPTVTVERGTFVREVHADGNLQAVRATPLALPPGLRRSLQIAWLAPDGQPVEEGDVVVRFDASEMALEMDEARDELATNRYKLEKESAESAAALGNLSRDSAMAELTLEGAREFQKKDPELFSRHEILESEVDESLAALEREHAEASEESQERLARAQLELLSIEGRQARQKRDEAAEALDSLEIRAPHDGLLVFRRDWRGNMPRVGDAAFSGNPLAEIPDLSTMEVELHVLEADAGGLEVGQEARVVVEAYPGEVFEGRVARVDTLAQPRRRGSPVQYFALTVALDETDPRRMKPGQRVSAVIELERLGDVLVVPRQAVFEEDGRYFVFRRDGGAFEERTVEVAATGTGRVAIRSGIEAGDRVALSDPRRPSPEAAEPAADASAGAPALPSAGGPPS
jgi:HlyD family secretion protein